MKQAIYFLAFSLLIGAGACNKVDNYDGPTETLQGRIIDIATGENVQSEVSGDNGNGTRIKLLETSWSDNPTPLFLATKQDGTFINTKVFAATYNISAEGAFVPLVRPDDDKSQNVTVRGGVTTVDFSVEPFLRVQWVGEPVINGDGTVSVQIAVTRGTSNPDFQQNITDIGLFVSPYPYVGNNNFDNRYTARVNYGGTAGNDIVGETITLTTIGELPARNWYLRVGSRTDYGLRQYNYNEPKMVTIQ